MEYPDMTLIEPPNQCLWDLADNLNMALVFEKDTITCNDKRMVQFGPLKVGVAHRDLYATTDKDGVAIVLKGPGKVGLMAYTRMDGKDKCCTFVYLLDLSKLEGEIGPAKEGKAATCLDLLKQMKHLTVMSWLRRGKDDWEIVINDKRKAADDLDGGSGGYDNEDLRSEPQELSAKRPAA